MKLTKDNYYSTEANQHYMSVSQYKDFLKCEAGALAKLNEDYEQPKSTAFLLGSYVHAWNEGTLEEFTEQHPELFSSKGATKGQLKSDFKLGDEMIRVLENDKFAMFALDGQKEVIMTGELFGAPWKIMIDVYNPQMGRFTDLKTVADLYKRIYVEDVGWCSFVEAYGYLTQMAVYSEIESQNRGGDWLETFIVAVSKQNPPDKAVISIDYESKVQALNEVEDHISRIIEVKHHGAKPNACGKCEYCRANKQLSGVIPYQELIG